MSFAKRCQLKESFVGQDKLFLSVITIWSLSLQKTEPVHGPQELQQVFPSHWPRATVGSHSETREPQFVSTSWLPGMQHLQIPPSSAEIIPRLSCTCCLSQLLATGTYTRPTLRESWGCPAAVTVSQAGHMIPLKMLLSHSLCLIWFSLFGLSQG